MKTICVLTATRAEYGLLKKTIEKLRQMEGLCVKVVVTGAHLCERFGLTWREIEQDKIPIDAKLDIGVEETSARSISETMARALQAFGAYFERTRPDGLLVLGDRYETLAVCIAAMNQRIPIFHMCGGETTEGAVDEGIRHAITKLSYLHFTSMEPYRKRVIQLGEAPERVFCVGAPGVENALTVPLMSKEELEESIGFRLKKPFGLVTFHPVTLEAEDAGAQMEQLIAALEALSGDLQFLITGANADRGSDVIQNAWRTFARENDNVLLVNSLGLRRYLSALRYCSVVIGNSSSGIVEAPSFHVGTVNIGDRQKGRQQAASTINVEPERTGIENAVREALSQKEAGAYDEVINPYGNGTTSQKVAEVICDWLLGDKIELKKPFYDIPFSDGERNER